MQCWSHSLTLWDERGTADVSVLLTSGLLYHILTMGAQMGGKDGVLPEWSWSRTKHKFCSCVLKRDLLESVPAEHEESDHTALITDSLPDNIKMLIHSESRESSASTETVQWRLLLFWNGEALFMLCSYSLMRIHLRFPLDIFTDYEIVKHFNVKHCRVFIRPYKYYSLSQNYKLKTLFTIFLFLKSEGKKKQCFKTKKIYNNTVIISV